MVHFNGSQYSQILVSSHIIPDTPPPIDFVVVHRINCFRSADASIHEAFPI